MNTTPNEEYPWTGDAHLARVGQLVDDYLRRQQDGEAVDVDALLAREDPEVRRAVREQIDLLRDVDTVFADGDELLDTTRRLGDYKILQEIGRGGMGVVYEAEQISLGRRVALKVLPLAGLLDARQLERFRNEARAAAQLRHSNVVPVFAVGQERGVHYYAMQFVEGRSLGKIMEELRARDAGAPDATRAVADSTTMAATIPGQTLESGDGLSAASTEPAGSGSGGGVRSLAYSRSVVRLVLQAADALDYAHQVGIVHRDVKPGNLIVDVQGRLWVTDFGLAQFSENTGLTRTGEILGTLNYMSPEQTRGRGVVVDHRTDIYSLGVTLYELLTLRLPFSSASRADVIHRIRTEQPRAPRALQPRLPADFETVVLKAIDKDPDMRYRTMGEFAADLRALLEDRPVQARRLGALERAWRWCRRNRAASGLAAMTIFLVGGALLSTAIVTTVQRSRDRALQAEARAQVFEALSRSRALRLDRGAGRKRSAMTLLDGVVTRLGSLDLTPGDRQRSRLQLRNELVAWESRHSARVETEWEGLGSPNAVFALCPDFEHYAVAGKRGQVEVYHIESREVVARVGEREPAPAPVFFSPSGRFLGFYRMGSDHHHGTLEVWDWRHNRPVLREEASHRLFGHDFGPGETLFAVKSEPRGDSIVLYDLNTGKAVASRRAPRGVRPAQLAANPDGTRVAVAHGHSYHVLSFPGPGGPFRSVLSETLVGLSGFSLPDKSYIHAVDWSPDGELLAFATDRGDTLVLDADTQVLVYMARGHQGHATTVRFSRDASLLATSSWDGTTRLFDAHSGADLLVLQGTSSCDFSLDGLRLGCAAGGGRRFYWKIERPRVARSLLWRSRSGEGSSDVAVSLDGRLAVTSHVESGLRLWDTSRGRELASLDTDAINTVTFGPADRNLLTFGRLGAHRWPLVRSAGGRWRLGPPRRIEFLPETARDTKASVGPAHRFFAAIDVGHIVCLDRRTGASHRLPRPVLNFAVSAEGLVAAAKMGNETRGQLWIFDLPASRMLARFDSLRVHVSFSPDGRWLVASTPQDIRILDMRELRSLAKDSPGGVVLEPLPPAFRLEKTRRHQSSGLSAFSADGRLLALRFHSRQIRVIAVDTWEDVVSFESPTSAEFRSMSFSPDGRSLLTSASDNRLHVWQLDAVAELIEQHGVGSEWIPHRAVPDPVGDEPIELEVLLGLESPFPRVRDEFTNELALRYTAALRETPADPELYRELGIWHERDGDREAALVEFERAARMAPDSRRHVVRLLEKLREMGRWDELAMHARDALGRFDSREELWDHWIAASFGHSGQAPEDLLLDLPGQAGGDDRRREEIEQLLDSLVSTGALRLSCTPNEYRDREGRIWVSDRFHVGGDFARGAERDIRGTEEDPLYHRVRIFPARGRSRAYRIPLPRGSYRVRIHLSEVSPRASDDPLDPVRVFDVIANDKVVARNYAPPAFRADVQEAHVNVEDGFLEISVQARLDHPILNAIEILRQS